MRAKRQPETDARAGRTQRVAASVLCRVRGSRIPARTVLDCYLEFRAIPATPLGFSALIWCWNDTVTDQYFYANEGWGSGGSGDWVDASTWFAGQIFP